MRIVSRQNAVMLVFVCGSSFIYSCPTHYVPARYEVSETDILTPKTYEEVMNSLQAGYWKEAINVELNSLKKSDSWDLVPSPETEAI
ncbi:hypothetical protein NPIL_228991 [Nephila pilipes]|uniref:Uncharacterized protein n=1 Tax=Nephila pilipes TaxID=299642 RepID=A0A8X6TSM0_NEPPI|nr:hypothetical protein NPIL_228991 [Nephila pilipes]